MPSSTSVNESAIDVSEAAATARSATPSGLPLLVSKLGWEGLVSERSAWSQATRAASARITARGFSRARRFDSLNVNGMVWRSFHSWFLATRRAASVNWYSSLAARLVIESSRVRRTAPPEVSYYVISVRSCPRSPPLLRDAGEVDVVDLDVVVARLASAAAAPIGPELEREEPQRVRRIDVDHVAVIHHQRPVDPPPEHAIRLADGIQLQHKLHAVPRANAEDRSRGDLGPVVDPRHGTLLLHRNREIAGDRLPRSRGVVQHRVELIARARLRLPHAQVEELRPHALVLVVGAREPDPQRQIHLRHLGAVAEAVGRPIPPFPLDRRVAGRPAGRVLALEHGQRALRRRRVGDVGVVAVEDLGAPQAQQAGGRRMIEHRYREVVLREPLEPRRLVRIPPRWRGWRGWRGRRGRRSIRQHRVDRRPVLALARRRHRDQARRDPGYQA